MRDVTLKSLTSQDRRRREFSTSEVVEDGGVQTRTDKRWIYTVKGQARISEVGDLQRWMRDRIGMDKSSNLKYLSILKSRDSKLSKDKFICNAMGDLFIMTEKCLFAIEFFYLMRIELAVLSCKKQENFLDETSA